MREVIEMAEVVTKRRVPIKKGSRRAGDLPRLVADASRARKELGWQTRYSDLTQIIATAWNWMRERRAIRQMA